MHGRNHFSSVHVAVAALHSVFECCHFGTQRIDRGKLTVLDMTTARSHNETRRTERFG
jgi:hypothetical protein